MLPDEVEPPNPFDCFNTVAEICGFLWKRDGESVLRQLLAMPGVADSNREPFEDAADQLRGVGLLAAAEIVAEFAAKLSPEVETCPHDPNTANGRAWMQSYRNRQRERQKKRERLGLSAR